MRLFGLFSLPACHAKVHCKLRSSKTNVISVGQGKRRAPILHMKPKSHSGKDIEKVSSWCRGAVVQNSLTISGMKSMARMDSVPATNIVQN
jgi:hypothetical protein